MVRTRLRGKGKKVDIIFRGRKFVMAIGSGRAKAFKRRKK